MRGGAGVPGRGAIAPACLCPCTPEVGCKGAGRQRCRIRVARGQMLVDGLQYDEERRARLGLRETAAHTHTHSPTKGREGLRMKVRVLVTMVVEALLQFEHCTYAAYGGQGIRGLVCRGGRIGLFLEVSRR
jgi:hypothetical protein